MKILYKYPTRDRPLKFIKCLNEYYKLMKNDNYEFVISLDHDDAKMNTADVKHYLDNMPKCNYFFGDNKSKIEAINANIPSSDWDILVLISDDMIPEIEGFDNIIREKMIMHYPDTDGVLWFYDGWRKDLNTLCILGRKYYERFNYIYQPDYISFWSDTEYTEVADILKKQTFIDQVIIRHLHPDIVLQDKSTREKFSSFLPEYANNGSCGHDMLWQKNSVFDAADKKTYDSRKKINFGLSV